MTGEFFGSPLVWTMFALGILGSLVACDNWLSRFCFAWSMVFAYFMFWGVLFLSAGLLLNLVGIDLENLERAIGWGVGITLVVLYIFQIYLMRGSTSGLAGGSGGSSGSRNPFRRSFTDPTGSA